MFHTDLLQQKFTRLQERPQADVQAIQAIDGWLRAQEPKDRLRINPQVIAQASNLPVEKIVAEMLYGVPLGLFDLYWDIHCPMCNICTDEHTHLSHASGYANCSYCALDFDVDFARAVEVTFALNREIENVELANPLLTPEIYHPGGKGVPPRLSGLDVIHLPAFWELFQDQTLSRRERLQISAVTTVFTDITGSTRMYDALGDVVAYNIVRDHFEILARSIEKHQGIVLKTIGDAVMASFIANEQALRSVLNALTEFEAYNQNRGVTEQVNIKIGIHRGPAILVNLNDRLDYFGMAINKAARIQRQAASHEILFSSDVYEDEAFQRALTAVNLTPISQEQVQLKGISTPQTIYRLAPAIPTAVAA
jgi:class 3 adenylate cyclase